MRWKRTLCFLVLTLVTFLCVKVLKHNLLASPDGCEVPKEVHLGILKISDIVHQILSGLDVTHFLCYDSLWGSLHYENPLPWKSEVEFCAVNDEALYKDEARFLRSFRKHNLDIEYNSVEGLYKVFNKTDPAGNVKLIIFEADPVTKMMRRVGWRRRVLPPDCEANEILHCFPPRLIEQPLPTKKLGKTEFPVPHEEIELQKYLYPSDWWRDLKPPNC